MNINYLTPTYNGVRTDRNRGNDLFLVSAIFILVDNDKINLTIYNPPSIFNNLVACFFLVSLYGTVHIFIVKNNMSVQSPNKRFLASTVNLFVIVSARFIFVSNTQAT